MKQIFSYIPREARKYQEMVQKRLILRAPPAQQPRPQVQQNQHPQPRQINQISQQQEQRPTQQYQVMNGNNNHQNDPVRDLVDDIIQKISTENDNVYISVSRITKITCSK
jgi:hypothetical protein